VEGVARRSRAARVLLERQGRFDEIVTNTQTLRNRKATTVGVTLTRVSLPGSSRISRKESSLCLAAAEKAPNKANGIGA